MTGTPDGVILGMKEPCWVSSGDVVEVRIEQLDSCVNEIAFDSGSTIWLG